MLYWPSEKKNTTTTVTYSSTIDGNENSNDLPMISV